MGVTGEEREAWQRSANEAGVSLSAFIRAAVEEARDLGLALERQADDERRRQERREAVESEPKIIPAAQWSRRPGPRTRPRMTIGHALDMADPGRG